MDGSAIYLCISMYIYVHLCISISPYSLLAVPRKGPREGLTSAADVRSFSPGHRPPRPAGTAPVAFCACDKLHCEAEGSERLRGWL